MKRKKHTGYLKLREEIELTKAGFKVWAYSGKGKFLGRVEISHAGLAAFTGEKGGNRLCDLSWEKFFERVAQGQRRKVKRFMAGR